MKFGITYSSAYRGVDPGTVVGYAKHAEDCGFESIYLPEHVALYPGATLDCKDTRRRTSGLIRRH